MKRTLLVLALAVLSTSGCRAIHSHPRQQCCEPCGEPCGAPAPCGEACGEPCCEPCSQPCCESCHVTRSQMAPRPDGCCEGRADCCGRGGDLESNCPGGNGCCFDRYCGHNCGPGYHPGPYDCSPCNSPHWGCTGHRHPQGYVTGRECMCDAHGNPIPCQTCGHCHPPGAGYCGGQPGPGACSSGDQYYNFNPGPPVAQTAYPYYTLRGPRDFLMDNPPSIGPY